jgi:hypothetical protein
LTGWAGGAADLVVAAGLVLGAAAFLSTRSARAALPVLLDLLLAAGLLRLASDGSWRAIAGAAAVVVIRKLVVATFLRGLPVASLPKQ